MAEYVKDLPATVVRLGELEGNVRSAQYELAASVALLRVAGVSWEAIGEGLGFSEGGRKQGARQWFVRNGGNVGVCADGQATLSGIDDRERNRLGRVLGLGDRKERFRVRVIVSGRHGINRVVYREVSTHLERARAERAAVALQADPPAEVWQVEANGSMRRLTIRKARPAPSSPAAGEW